MCFPWSILDSCRSMMLDSRELNIFYSVFGHAACMMHHQTRNMAISHEIENGDASSACIWFHSSIQNINGESCNL